MFTTNKALEILNMVHDKYPSINCEDYEIVMDESFSYEISEFGNIVTVTGTIEDENFLKFIDEYLLSKELNVNDYTMRNLYEVFGFLHEIGHIYNNNVNEESQPQYDEFYSKDNQTEEEKFFDYRNIKAETVADEFAINMIKTYTNEICKIVNSIDIEEAYEMLDYMYINEL